MNYERLNITNLADGAVDELFARELARVMDNIVDPNTDATTKREITIKVTFTPKKDRQSAEAIITCKSKLAASLEAEGNLLLSSQQGQLVALTHNPRQQWLYTPVDQESSQHEPANQGEEHVQ